MSYYKKVQIICWCVVFVVFIGSGLWFTLRSESVSWNISIGFQNLSGPYNEVGRYRVDSSEIKNLQVSWTAGGIIITPYEENEITIIEYAQRELKEEENLKMNTNSNTLKIDYCKASGYMQMPPKKLEVFIPADLAKSLEKVMVAKTSATLEMQDIEANECEILSSSGDSSLINLRFDKLDVDVSSGYTYLDESVVKKLSISSSSGDVNISDLEGSNLTIESTSGEVNIRDYVGENVSINTTSGEARLEEVTTNQINIDTTSGDVIFKGSFHDLEADSSSGKFKITNQLPPNSFNIGTTSGDVTLIMPVFEDFDLTFDTSSGDLESDIPMRKVNSSKFKISTSSGDVAIISLK